MLNRTLVFPGFYRMAGNVYRYIIGTALSSETLQEFIVQQTFGGFSSQFTHYLILDFAKSAALVADSELKVLAPAVVAKGESLYSISADLPQASIEIGLYEHYKKKPYAVLGVSRCALTKEDFVLYKAMYGDHGLWLRPFAMFNETIEVDGLTQNRFQLKSTLKHRNI